MAIVAVFSGIHCHGEAVAEKVASELGCERIDSKLLDEASRRFELPKDKLSRAMTGPAPFWNSFTREREKSIAALKAALADLVMEDRKLLFGYAALLVPNTISHALRVCVAANFPYRVRQAAAAEGLSEDAASDLIRRDDDQRLQWTRLLFDQPPYDESLYDLVVPMQDRSVEEAAGLVCDAARGPAVATTEVSRVAARDFQLAAQVNLVLARANHDVEVSARHGEIVISLKAQVLRMQSYQEELKALALRVPGVSGAKVQLGAKCRVSSINTMANLELPPKILLVDDEKEFVTTLSERLKTRNLESAVVHDGEKALEYVESDQPDVMVLDLMMPGIGGIEVLRRLKKTHPNIEVIILTGHGSEAEEKMAADLGAFAYLHKPVNIEVLAQAMRDAYRKVGEARAKGGEDTSDRGRA
ncbi:MAG: response regulator [Elusimicrobia bacterium]|nr:response regulator [Elusimicrobiota bacterium]